MVIDASVALKWYLDEEDHSSKAIRLLQNYISNEFDIIAPSLLEYEVVNGLIIAQKRGRIKEERILMAIEGFMNLGIKFIDLSTIYSKVIHYCRNYNFSAYDSSYMAVAEEKSADLITADKGLYSGVKKNLKWVRWLGDV